MKNLIKLLKKDWKDIKKLDQNRKILLIVIFAVVFVASIVAGAYIFAPKQLDEFTQSLPINQPREETVTIPTAQPSTNLSIQPLSGLQLQADVPQEISVELGGLAVSAIDISLTWDESLLEVSNLTNGKIFGKEIINKITPGKIRYSASLSPDLQDAPSDGTVFTFTVTPKKTAIGSEASIQFDPIGTITALYGENTLGSTTDVIYTIVE